MLRCSFTPIAKASNFSRTTANKPGVGDSKSGSAPPVSLQGYMLGAVPEPPVNTNCRLSPLAFLPRVTVVRAVIHRLPSPIELGILAATDPEGIVALCNLSL